VPVLGDLRYGGAAKKLWPRLALHARRLALAHPITGERLVVESPIPDDLEGLWSAISGSSR
jgi:23S rRNA-/tRNA-specific pseudouridylate synthase